MEKNKTLSCPECGATIDIDEVLIHQLEDKVKKELEAKYSKKEKEFQKKLNDIRDEKEKIEKEKENLRNTVNKEVQDKLKREKQKLEKQLRDKIQDEQSELVKALQDELKEKSDKLKDLNRAKAQVQRLEREKDEMKAKLEAEAEKRITEKIKEERAKIKKAEEEKIELKLIEKDNLIKQLNDKLKEAQKKVEQGSMQAQGEAQEIGIEEFLRENFPLDTIEEIKKGARGADCLQIIHTRTKQNCGSIYYESKRTKNFSAGWIEKFKNDMREKGANIGVLVTETMPNNMQRMGQVNGVWVCSFSEFKGLCFVLRESVVQISNAIATQENKGEKMAMLYDFLTGNEFRLQVEAIVEGFTQMKEDLEKEKRLIQGHWKRREKQIEKVVLNTNVMYNAIKGIAGNAIQPVQALEIETDKFLEGDIDMGDLENHDLGEDGEKE